MKKTIIYGKNGQVGSALAEILKDNAVVFASSEYDFSNIENVRKALSGIDACAIINATAYTDVNKAETDEEAAYKANGLIPGALALYANEKNIPFIHYSTDYVFSGEGNEPHKESETTAPLNAYGRTKLAGEEKISKIGGKYLIFRTSWVYDHKGKNFLNTMLKFGKERESLSVVADQFGAPTYAAHLAEATINILEELRRNSSPSLWEKVSIRVKSICNCVIYPHPIPLPGREEKFPSGIYNLCNSGFTSWHGFASEIFTVARAQGIELKVNEVKPISADEFPTPAKRPVNSRLDLSLVSHTFGITMPDWKNGVSECVSRLNNN